MIPVQKIKALMGGEQTIKFDNGVVLSKQFDTVLVGKMKDLELQWIENFNNLPEQGKNLIVKMLKARKVMLSFDTEFNIVTKGIVIDKTPKTEKK